MKGFRALGVDACRDGWVVAAADVDAHGTVGTVTISVAPDLASVLRQRAEMVVIDLPIGLPATRQAGGRACDVAARSLLGPARGSSVFSAPPRAALDLVAWDDPRRADLGLTKQSFALLPRIREVDAVMTPDLHDPDADGPSVIEVHPEVAFHDLNGGLPLAVSKQSEEGRLRRRMLLEQVLGRPIPVMIPRGAADDDVLDALACLWVAAGHRDRLSALPDGDAPRDSRGLAMQIWRRDAASTPAPRTRRISPETAVVDRLLAELGPMPGVRVARGSGTGNRIGVAGWDLGGLQRFQFGDLRLEGERGRVIVEIETAGGITNLAKLWPLLRIGGDGMDGVASLRDSPFLLLHLFHAATPDDYVAHRRLWEFLVERMEADLGPRGRRRGGWEAELVVMGPGAPEDPIPAVAARIRDHIGIASDPG